MKEKKRRAAKYTVAVGTSHGHGQYRTLKEVFGILLNGETWVENDIVVCHSMLRERVVKLFVNPVMLACNDPLYKLTLGEELGYNDLASMLTTICVSLDLIFRANQTKKDRVKRVS